MLKVERVLNFETIQKAAGVSLGKRQSKITEHEAYQQEHSILQFGEWLIQSNELCRAGCLQMKTYNKRDGFYSLMQTSRPDRTERGHMMDRNEPLWFIAKLSDAAMIHISKQRLCQTAEEATSIWWIRVHARVKAIEPELAARMVPECITRGFCKEPVCCGYINTFDAKIIRDNYIKSWRRR